MTDLHAYLIYFRDIAIRASERRSIALEEHWLIFRGMKTKNIDQITLLTHEHLNRSLQFILKEMERRQLNKQRPAVARATAGLFSFLYATIWRKGITNAPNGPKVTRFFRVFF